MGALAVPAVIYAVIQGLKMVFDKEPPTDIMMFKSVTGSDDPIGDILAYESGTGKIGVSDQYAKTKAEWGAATQAYGQEDYSDGGDPGAPVMPDSGRMLAGIIANAGPDAAAYLQQSGQLQTVVNLLAKTLSQGLDTSTAGASGSGYQVKYGNFNSYEAMRNLVGDSPELKAYADAAWEARKAREDLNASSYDEMSASQERRTRDALAALPTAQQAFMQYLQTTGL